MKCLALIAWMLAATGRAADLKLIWPTNSDPNVVTYRLYYGAPDYTNTILTTTNSVFVTGLTTGVVYTFNVAAARANGIESDFLAPTTWLVASPKTNSVLSLDYSSVSVTGPWSNVFVSTNIFTNQGFYRMRLGFQTNK